MTNSIYHAILLSAKNEIIGKYWDNSKTKAQSKALSHARKGQKVITITDKQFGMTTNSWDGVPRATKWGRPFIAKQGKMISVFPLTKMQYQNILTK